MNYRLIGKKEKSLWNEFVMNSSRGHVFQSYEWGEVMACSGWKPLRLVVEDRHQIRGGISILKKKILSTPWSILYSPRGPAIDFDDHKSFSELVKGIKEVALSEKAIFLQIVPHAFYDENGTIKSIENKNFIKIEKEGIFRLTQPVWVYRIDLKKSEDEILSQMKRKTRYSVRLSLKKGVTITQKKDLKDLKIFYGMLRESSKRKNFPIRSFSYFESLWNNLAPSGYARLFFANCNGKTLAGELVLRFGDICWDMYRASVDSDRNLRPNYALQWKIMQWAKQKGCLWYSLRGVPSFNPPPEHGGYGVYKFKKGFGGVPFTYAGDYYYIFKPKLYKLWENGERMLNKCGKMLLKIYSG